MALVNRGGGNTPPPEIDEGDNDVAQQGDRVVLINGRDPKDILGFPLEQRLLNVKVVDKAGGENDYAEIEVADPDGKFLAYTSNMADGSVATHIFTVKVGYYWQDEDEYATVVGTPSVERCDFGAEDMKIKLKIHSILQMFKEETTWPLPTVDSGDPKKNIKEIIKGIAEEYKLEPIIQEEGAFNEIGSANQLKAKHFKKNAGASDYERLKQFAEQLTGWEKKQIEEVFKEEYGESNFDHKKWIDERRAMLGYEPKYGTDTDREVADTTVAEDLKEYFREERWLPEDKEIKLGTTTTQTDTDTEPKKYVTAQVLDGDRSTWSFRIKAGTLLLTDTWPDSLGEILELGNWADWDDGDVKKILETGVDGLEVLDVQLLDLESRGRVDVSKQADVTVSIPPDMRDMSPGEIKNKLSEGADTWKTFQPYIKNFRLAADTKVSMDHLANTLDLNKAERGVLENVLTGKPTEPGKDEAWSSRGAAVDGLKGFEMTQKQWVFKVYGDKLFFGRRQKWQKEIMHRRIPVYQWRHGNHCLYGGKARYTKSSEESKGMLSFFNIGNLLGGNEEGEEEKVVNADAVNEGLGQKVSPLEHKLQTKVKNLIDDKITLRLNDVSAHEYQGELDVVQLKSMVSRDLEMQEVEVVGSPFLRADNFVALDFNFMEDWAKPMLYTNIYIVTKVKHQLDSEGILKTKLTGHGQSWDNTAGMLKKFYGVPDSQQEQGGGNMITNMISNVFPGGG